jgi:hypothetical protein
MEIFTQMFGADSSIGIICVMIKRLRCRSSTSGDFIIWVLSYLNSTFHILSLSLPVGKIASGFFRLTSFLLRPLLHRWTNDNSTFLHYIGCTSCSDRMSSTPWNRNGSMYQLEAWRRVSIATSFPQWPLYPPVTSPHYVYQYHLSLNWILSQLEVPHAKKISIQMQIHQHLALHIQEMLSVNASIACFTCEGSTTLVPLGF